ncbi:hypothetical protein D3C73_1324820 [compost metagenome]
MNDASLRSTQLDDLLDAIREEKEVLFLLYKFQQTSFHSSVKGVTINDLGWVDFRQIWFLPDPLI